MLLLALGILGPGSLAAQDPDEPDVVSFFSAVAVGLAEIDVFAIDAQSFAAQLRDHLSEALTPDAVQDLIGPDFRYGPIDRWVSCDGETPCEMAYPGTHVSLLRVTARDDPGDIVLRLARTGGADGGVWRTFGSIRVQQVEGRWRVVEASRR
jgi:hypothetical protein